MPLPSHASHIRTCTQMNDDSQAVVSTLLSHRAHSYAHTCTCWPPPAVHMCRCARRRQLTRCAHAWGPRRRALRRRRWCWWRRASKGRWCKTSSRPLAKSCSCPARRRASRTSTVPGPGCVACWHFPSSMSQAAGCGAVCAVGVEGCVHPATLAGLHPGNGLGLTMQVALGCCGALHVACSQQHECQTCVLRLCAQHTARRTLIRVLQIGQQFSAWSLGKRGVAGKARERGVPCVPV